MEKTKKRIEWVDYAKAFACFLVVLGHIIQALQKSNLDLHTNITTFVEWFIYLFHMPLFMCLSGYLYIKTKKTFSWKNYKNFATKKFINLAVPYFTFYTIFILLNMVFANSVNTTRGIGDLLKIFNQPLAPFWFLYALLAIFLVIPILENIFKDNKKHVYGVLVLLKIISIFINTKIYFIDAIMQHSIYFYLGAFINDEKQKNRPILVATYIILALIFYKLRLKLNFYVISFVKIFFAIIGTYISINIFKKVNTSRILDTFKKYTFQIYLIHTIFAAAVRILLLKIGINQYFIHLIVGMLVGIYAPVIVSKISDKIRYTNFFFYPLNTIEQLKERKDTK